MDKKAISEYKSKRRKAFKKANPGAKNTIRNTKWKNVDKIKLNTKKKTVKKKEVAQ